MQEYLNFAIENARQAARRLFSWKIQEGYRPAGLYTYSDWQGNVRYYRARLDKDGEKYIRPFHKDGEDFVLGEPDLIESGKPLYNLPNVVSSRDCPIHVVEGEKCVDALKKKNIVATTSGVCEWMQWSRQPSKASGREKSITTSRSEGYSFENSTPN